MNDQDKQDVVDVLNEIMELELAGVVRYTHYSLMVNGYSRIPIISWLKGNADESLAHAHKAGELVTLLGGHPSLKIAVPRYMLFQNIRFVCTMEASLSSH